ncbi:hypothetical protein DYB28_013316 [Aphanomyces astaci]|uniref:Uncharacterized protein n=1 Tax=Aphanomyces astaci TaxID=112090 RepID=A0A397C7H0_APHAT|nr:hypothetical protein DYB36_001625 [Aphanomyces astaci]RHY19443.1 hypothetical protein DYB25_002310 [Aphanomyces astaci]RHY40826.1 hypothetical protein DYB38_008084 [Aphanomyces astaci]RHY46060.1 hypothetical protein DYB30_005863 [Aphanomyces astaci]RHY65412.1 hypothetical protein DYB34_006570 [Aphanomyces astaci]
MDRFLGLEVVVMSVMNCTPLLVTMAVFAAFTLWMHQQKLTTTNMFSALALSKAVQETLITFVHDTDQYVPCLK